MTFPAILALLLAAFVPAPAEAVTDWLDVREQLEEQMIELMNAERARHGVAPLELHVELVPIARGWSEHMAAEEIFFHNPDYVADYPAGWYSAGENIARYSLRDSLEATVEAMHEGLYNSPGHRANMLNERFNTVGVGLYVDPAAGHAGSMWGTVNFMGWSQPSQDDGGPRDGGRTERPTSGPSPKTPPAPRFRDVPDGHPHGLAIARMAQAGVVGGYGDGTFRPAERLTRAQMASLVARALELPQDAQAGFRDVPSGYAHEPAIAAVAAAGVVTGFDDGTFRPAERLTRAQAATMLVRAFEVQSTSGGSGFVDVGSGPHAATIAAAAAAGMITGYDDGTFRPGNDLSRAQAATMFDRLLHR